MSADPTTVGTVVLANLAEGRAVRREQQQRRAAALRELIQRAARLDRADTKPDRGRAGRISRRLRRDGIDVSERWVRKIIGTSGPAVPEHSARLEVQDHPERNTLR